MAKKSRRKRNEPTFTGDRPSTRAKNRRVDTEPVVQQVKFTVELPELTRRSLKVKAAMAGISMREFLLQALKDAGVDVP